MDLNLLKTFDAVIKSKSVNEAAEVLDITAPAVSQALNRLRDEYKDPLFIRQGRGIVPTNFAIELHNEIQEPLSLLLNGSKSRHDFDPALSQRTFRISSHKDIDLMVVPSLVRYKREHAPNISIQADIEHLNEQERHDDLRRRRVDVILATVPLEDRGYHNQVLFEQELVVLVSKDHPRIQNELTVEDFFRERHITWKTQRLNTLTLDSVAIDVALPPRQVAYSTGSGVTAMVMAAQTDWLAVINQWHAEQLADPLGLSVFPVPFETEKVPIYMTWHQSQKKDKGHEWLREAIVTSLGARGVA
ncbi:LysR family transcriptional regulator [Vibrio harveyi]|nr:LysR family transcriptional regulator [Vibrio harveyi]MCG9235702.1 LysR family transcriptional regulator [Vibrio harveyi]MCG9585971.1 LysR family transcriptional regulator [Vibrio harveyi]CAH1206982.1 LysR family transcriptional regulator [Vibrio harveyi]CAH1549963.1 LysR family transcriptional regulator [Vibrio harveyi]CAH1554120.1 LysR family transcriptional regulator [Vibrio harveyi]